MSQRYHDSSAHLDGALLVLNLRLHRQVLRWRATHHEQATQDELLGLYVSDRDVDALLDGLYAARAPAGADAADQAPLATVSELLRSTERVHRRREAAALAAGVPLRLPLLTERLGLDDFERDVVVLALAPETDRRYERLFGYLNDDATFRTPSVGLALQLLCGDRQERGARRRAFAPAAPLRAARLVELVDHPGGATLLSHGLRLDAAVASYLLGGDDLDPALLAAVTTQAPHHDPPLLDPAPAADVARLAGHLRGTAGPAIIELSGPDAEAQDLVAAHLAAAAGRTGPLIIVDLQALPGPGAVADAAARAAREARLGDGGLALRVPAGEPETWGIAEVLAVPGPPLRFLLTPQPLPAPLRTSPPLHRVRLPAPEPEARRRLWDAALGGRRADVDSAELAERFRLTTAQIRAAAGEAAARAAAAEGGGLRRSDLFASCRAQAGVALPGLAELVESALTWDHLVVPAEVKEQLLGIQHWVQHHRTVYTEWGFAERVLLGRGLTVLFTGPSGTGKTMAAGILARALELDLYRVDLSAVVSKYIGETEKNLARIFSAASAANAVLFFDEADALFGKRSEVKDAHDRYANIEVSYLLQRMEAYDGVAILASNFPDNLDRAFARRIHVTIEFPFPQAADRERIWHALLAGPVPCADDIDLAFLGRQFALTGGHIRNCALTAAFAAAADGGVVRMGHLVRAVARELEKARQPVVRSGFGPYYDLIRDADAAGARTRP